MYVNNLLDIKEQRTKRMHFNTYLNCVMNNYIGYNIPTI